jgi:D-alanyl-D-alanine carboxypeptidase (penicillin-binding protein 5/6)
LFLRRFFSVISAAVITLSANGVSTAAESSVDDSYNSVYSSVTDIADAQSIYVCDTVSGKALCQKNADEVLPMGHMAKLMTILIAAEQLEKGSLTLEETVVVSDNANSKQGTQIWLEKGEEISVEELLKSIIVGNANDACTALAERLSGSEEDYVSYANERAKQLKMDNTVFSDSCGTDKSTVSTAKDIGILSTEIVKYTNLTGYFTTWIDTVRCQAVQLVSTNRLIRTYKGTVGLKSCFTDGVGESVSAVAKRGNMGVCVVLLGCESDDGKFSLASDLLDISFESFRIFEPEIDSKFTANIAVTGGEKDNASVKLQDFTGVIIPAGKLSEITEVCELPETVSAPVKKGDVLAEINYISGDESLLTVRILANEDVGIMNFGCAVKKCLLNLLNI